MAYETVGVKERMLGEYLPQLCMEVMQDGGGQHSWESSLQTAFTGLNNFPPNKFLVSTTLADLWTIRGNAQFTPGSPQMRRLMHVLCLVLFKAGVIKECPGAYEWVGDFRSTLDRCVSAILTTEINFPTLQDFGGDKARWGQVAPIVATFMRQCAQGERFRRVYTRQLREYAGHIGYKIYRSETLDDVERSFFLMIAPGGPRAASVVDQTSPGVIVYPERIRCALCTSRAVEQTWAKYRSVATSGPWGKYVAFASFELERGRGFMLCQPPKAIPVHLGYQNSFGPFVRFEAEPIFDIPYDMNSQVDALTEKISDVRALENGELIRVDPPVQMGAAQEEYVADSLDDPAFRLFFEDFFPGTSTPGAIREMPFIEQFEVAYDSAVGDRMLSTVLGTFPGAGVLLYEKCVKGEAFGTGQVGELQIPTNKLVNQELTSNFAFGFIPQATGISATVPVIIENLPFIESIFWPNSAQKAVLMTTVDMNPLMKTFGDLVLLGAGRSNVLVPRRWLCEAQTAAEDFIFSRLGIHYRQRPLVEDSIRISHNYAKYMMLLGARSLPSMNPLVVALSRIGS
jgi:hypothetical protein